MFKARRATGVGILATMFVLALPGAAGAQEFAFEFGDPGAELPERLGTASSIAVDADGNPWVADTTDTAFTGARVVKYDYNGGVVAEFRSFGDVPMVEPNGIAADDDGFLYIVQGFDDPRIVKIDTGGVRVDVLRLKRADGTVVAPHKIDVDPQGRLYVSDGLDTVHVFSASGNPIRRIRLPTGRTVKDVAVDRGEMFISFATAALEEGVARYSADGRLLSNIGPFLAVSFQELSFDPAGNVYVADYANSVVRRYNRDGTAINTIGARGIELGQMNGPEGLATDCRGNLYVLDSAARFDGDGVHRAGSKVLKFAVPAEPPPCAPRSLPGGAIDTQVNDVEATQAIQPQLSFTAGPILPPGQQAFTVPETAPRTRAYGSSGPGVGSGEVQLKTGLKTVIRVYANLSSGPPGGIANIPATLEAVTAGGQHLDPIQALARPALLRVGGRTVAGPLRTDPTGAYTFDLPDEWTRKGTIDLIARVNPAAIGCDAQCVNRSSFRLTGVSFGAIREVPVMPVALTRHGQLPIKDPARAFELAQRTTPLRLTVHGYQAQAEVGDLMDATSVTVERCFIGVFPCSEGTYTPGNPKFREYIQGELFDRLESAAEGAEIDECDRVPVGLIGPSGHGQLPGAMTGEFLAAGLLPCAFGYLLAKGRPLTSVSHELQHAFGRPHAGQGCPGTAEGDDQEGEPWPPDDRGLLGGVGLNTTTRAVGSAPHTIIAAGAGGSSAEAFDLMSYCAGDESSAWISPRGWGYLSTWRVPRPAAAVAQGMTPGGGVRLLRVTAMETSDGELGITSTSPTTVAAPPGNPASPYVLEALDAAGGVLASAPVDADELGDSTAKLITGTVPLPPGTAQVFLRRGTETGTRRVGSENPPKVKLIAPRAGTRAMKGSLVVRWRARDRDGGSLTATVEYSANGGKKWEAVHVGPDSGRARIPLALLTGSRRAQVRVRVDDGFNEGVATSKRFTVGASAPLVRITDPAGKPTIPAGAPLELRGGAIGAGGRPIAGGKLRWFDGRDKLGRGDSLTAKGLDPGRHRITLRAAQGGRTGRASVTVKVRGVKPGFLRLDAPATVPRRARSVSLRVASTVDASLSAGGKRFDVTPRARRVKIPIGSGKGDVRLRLQLRAGGKVTRQPLTIPRG